MEYEAVQTVTHLHFFAVESPLRQIEVGVVEHGKHGMETAHDVGGERQEFFLSLAQNVRFGLLYLFERIVVSGKVGVGDIRFEFFVVERGEFGLHERHFRHQFGNERAHHRRIRGVFGNPDVLVVFHAGIKIQLFEAAGKGVAQLEKSEKFLAEFSLIGGKPAVFKRLLEVFVFLFPSLVGREDGRKVPGVFCFYVFSFHDSYLLLAFL